MKPGRDADVIIVGGGPAGVAAGLELRRQGVERVMLLDREADLGGATRHCAHSPFGMLEFGRVYIGGAYGRRLTREAVGAGLDLRMRHSVVALAGEGAVEVSHPGGVEQLRARRVLLATGAREKTRAARHLSGDRPIGVITTGTLQAYVAFHGLMPFRRPLILGSELVSMSALTTCLSHGARPVALAEPGPRLLARAPFCWAPRLAGVPVFTGARVVDIKGRGRVEAVVLKLADGSLRSFDCDGLLLSGQFVPEAALSLTAGALLAPGSGAPQIDQFGRTEDPWRFAAGNLLRPIETGGWAFREGRAVASAVAADLGRAAETAPPVVVTFDDPVKLVVPSLMRPNPDNRGRALKQFQLRFTRAAKGKLSLHLDGREAWSKRGQWLPERRVLVPMPAATATAGAIAFRFDAD